MNQGQLFAGSESVEMAHQDLGDRLIERIKVDIESIAVVDQEAKMEGRQIIMVLSPKRTAG